MPLKQYGVLVGRAEDRVREGSGNTPHYQVRVQAYGGEEFRVAVNVLSQAAPSELLFVADDDYRNPLTDVVSALPPGWHPLASQPGSGALDFVRGNLFDPTRLRKLPPDAQGPDNDLADLLDHYVQRAIADPDAVVFAFGQRWGPEPGVSDKVFDFLPGNGVHDIHMNQGNSAPFLGDDGIWQDGGLLIHFPGESRWIAVFLAFQNQAWHTDGGGHAIEGPAPTEVARVRVLAARVNPVGPAPEDETVLLINASPEDIDLTGWSLSDRAKDLCPIPAVVLGSGETFLVHLNGRATLGNQGGQISVLDSAGLKVHGVSYTAEDASREGWTVVF